MRGWRLILKARCEHTSRIDSDEWDGPVATDRWVAARLHRLVCGPCRCEHRSMNRLRRLLAAVPRVVRDSERGRGAVRLSAEASARIETALRHASGGA